MNMRLHLLYVNTTTSQNKYFLRMELIVIRLCDIKIHTRIKLNDMVVLDYCSSCGIFG